MELHIKSSFDCVYFVNGEFFEKCDTLETDEFDVIYVTVMPIKPTLLPYTVRLTGAGNIFSDLYDGMRLDENNFLLCLKPRYMIVYGSAPKKQPVVLPSPISRLFSLVKDGDLAGAYAMLSDDLKSTVDKSGVAGFFAGFDRLEECFWKDGTDFYLIDANGVARAHSYSMKDEFIDNIIEKD